MEPGLIPISYPYDLEIQIDEYDSADRRQNPTRSAIFQLDKSRLAADSKFIRDKLAETVHTDHSPSRLVLKKYHVIPTTILFQCLYGTPERTWDEETSIAVESVTMKDIWHLILACWDFVLDTKTERLRQWFVEWYTVQDSRTYKTANQRLLFRSQVMFPCFEFDHAEGMLATTRDIVYNRRESVKEYNPTRISRLHLPERIEKELNAARGRLKTTLQTKLFDDANNLNTWANCPCRDRTFVAYFRELSRVDVWPQLSMLQNTTINDILQRLQQFNPTNVRYPDDAACPHCDKDWGKIVAEARKDVLEHFDGFCLDCVNITQSSSDPRRARDPRRSRDQHREHWRRGEDGRYDTYCRVTHGESTSYHSCNVRKEYMPPIAN